MRPTLVWTVGGGLLGKPLKARALSTIPDARAWAPEGGPFPWHDRARLRVAIQASVRDFVGAMTRGSCDWMVLWAAGASVIGSSPAAIRDETEVWRYFLQLLETELDANKTQSRGTIFLASSAGAIYAGTDALPITESAPVAPISDYGRGKLAQEEALKEAVARLPRTKYLIGRISNLYGPGQNMQKPQGLISQISRALLFRAPVNIYVSLDTMRDYLFASDCAADIVRCLLRLGQKAESACGVTKIFASEEPRTIAEVIAIFRLIAGRRPTVLTLDSPVRRQQASRLCFRSTVWPGGEALRLPLVDGIARVHRENLALFTAGKLPRPLAA